MSQTTDNPIERQGGCIEARPDRRKPYTKPAIIYELGLETRAGSPLGIPHPLDAFDPFKLEPKE